MDYNSNIEFQTLVTAVNITSNFLRIEILMMFQLLFTDFILRSEGSSKLTMTSETLSFRLFQKKSNEGFIRMRTIKEIFLYNTIRQIKGKIVQISLIHEVKNKITTHNFLHKHFCPWIFIFIELGTNIG